MKNIFFDADIYQITSPYGMRNGKMHNGEDWGTGIGTGLFSIRPGGIVNNWVDPVGGNIISITYNDIHIRFQFHHCKDFSLSKTGDHPAQGAAFGLTGNTGNSTGPHVHIEVFESAHITSSGVIDKQGIRVNPNSYTTNQDLVLKPSEGTQKTFDALYNDLINLVKKYS